MKKAYETPSIEVVKFQYRDQVVVASNQFYDCTNIGTKDTQPCYDVTVERNKL